MVVVLCKKNQLDQLKKINKVYLVPVMQKGAVLEPGEEVSISHGPAFRQLSFFSYKQ